MIVGDAHAVSGMTSIRDVFFFVMLWGGVTSECDIQEQVERTSFMIFSKVPFTKNQPASEEVFVLFCFCTQPFSSSVIDTFIHFKELFFSVGRQASRVSAIH